MKVENSQFRSFWVWESDSANFNLSKRGNFRSAAFEGVGRREVWQDNVVLWTELMT